MAKPGVNRSFSQPNIHLKCRCGWEGLDDNVEDWEIQQKQDRAIRKCPSCESSVPEWGVLQPIEGAARIARGSLHEALIEADYNSA